MAKENAILHGFNRGLVSKKALARVDIERLRLSAERQENWMPFTLGPMMLRPGTQFMQGIYGNLSESKDIPFVFGTNDAAILECTLGNMRPIINDLPITRPSVATTIGAFGTWTITNTGAATTSVVGSTIEFVCPAYGGRSVAEKAVTISAPNQNVEHGIRISITRGPISFRVGTTSGDDNLFSEAVLGTGTHSLAVTPTTGTMYVQFESRENVKRILASVSIEAAGEVVLPTAWATAGDMSLLRWDQSGDVVFVACYGHPPAKIERRSARSWSVVEYVPDDGPFKSGPDKNTRVWSSVSFGNGTMSSETAVFKSTHVGASVRAFTSGYAANYKLAAEDVYTPSFRIAGIGSDRTYSYTLSGTWTATVTVQRSFDGPDSGFIDVTNYIANTSASGSDGFNNSIVWYRLAIKSGNYTSGTVEIAISHSGGGEVGIARIVSYTSATQVGIEVLHPFSSSNKTLDWRLSEWSAKDGYPSSVAFHDGRLVWGWEDKFVASVSDAYASFDLSVEGDAGPIQKSLGSGPAQIINWLLSLQRLIIGGQMSEKSARSSSFDEPLTPTNVTLKDCSTQGSGRVAPLKVDTRGIFVNHSGRQLYELSFNVERNDYVARNLCQLFPDICPVGVSFTRIAVQRETDTRIHCVMSNGTVAILTFEPEEEVLCWWTYVTDGLVKDVCILPSTPEDRVYYVVQRTINGTPSNYREKWALESECIGGTITKCLDCHLVYSGAPVTTIPGLFYLAGETVSVWANGKDLGTKVVSSIGEITGLSESVVNACIGLPYDAYYKSTKLAYAAQGGTALTQKKILRGVGLILENTHARGLQVGQSFTTMDNLPLVYRGATVDPHLVYSEFDEAATTLPGQWDTDARLHIKASSPRPATVVGVVIPVLTNET